jgi:SEC-C motif-containing protein
MFLSGDHPLNLPCPCGSQNNGKLLAQCCEPYLQGQLSAPTAEALMRSRYSAYCLKNIDYLLNTHHPTQHESNSRRQIAASANGVTWLGLTIIFTEAGQPEDQTGVVEFVARYQEGRYICQLHERSRFLKEQGKWFYLDGEMLPPLEPKKNDPCWCNSGKKFKQCHGKKRG